MPQLPHDSVYARRNIAAPTSAGGISVLSATASARFSIIAGSSVRSSCAHLAAADSSGVNLSQVSHSPILQGKFRSSHPHGRAGTYTLPPAAADYAHLQRFNSVKISNIVRCYRIVDLDGNTRFREHCNRTVGSFKSTAAAAKFFIGCFGCSVKRDIHPLRRELSEQLINLFFAEHRSVCVYRNDNAEFTASAIDFFKIGPNKRLASGQQQKQHAALLRFPSRSHSSEENSSVLISPSFSSR